MCLLGHSGSQNLLPPFLSDSVPSRPSKPRPPNIAFPVPTPWTATLKMQTLASQNRHPDLTANSQPQHYLLPALPRTSLLIKAPQTPAPHHRKVFFLSIITVTASSVLRPSKTIATPRTIPSRPQTASAVPPAQTPATSLPLASEASIRTGDRLQDRTGPARRTGVPEPQPTMI